jgi:hypothetical protein
LIFVERSIPVYRKGVKQFVVIINAYHLSNSNSIGTSKFYFRLNSGVFSDDIFWAVYKMYVFATAQGT